ncbi:MAG: GxxExxY protein [Anaerolineales bacterium]|nr:GxxExxY protein [Anaerolineales bacterium]
MNQTNYVDEKYPLSALTGRIIAAAQAVHRVLGPGFEEVICQRSLALELPVYDVEFTREVWIDVLYRGQKDGKKRVDFIAGDQTGQVMVEIKAKSKLEDVDYVQTLSYLKASGYEIGLLINFGSKNLEVRRLINSAP